MAQTKEWEYPRIQELRKGFNPCNPVGFYLSCGFSPFG